MLAGEKPWLRSIAMDEENVSRCRKLDWTRFFDIFNFDKSVFYIIKLTNLNPRKKLKFTFRENETIHAKPSKFLFHFQLVHRWIIST